MGFWIFKKKKTEIYKDQIKTLQSSLKSSFVNVKKDMKNISDWIGILDEKDKEQDQELQKLRKRISLLEMKLDKVVEDLEEEEIFEEPVIEEIRESTTKFSGVISSFQSLTSKVKMILQTPK